MTLHQIQFHTRHSLYLPDHVPRHCLCLTHHIFISNFYVQDGNTALHYGVKDKNNLLFMIKLLLEHNADVNIQNKVARGLRDHVWCELRLRLMAIVTSEVVLNALFS